MNIRSWLTIMPDSVQAEVWKKLLLHLSNREIMKVMEEARKDRDLFEIHQELGLIEKYRADLNRILDTIHMKN